MPPKAYELVTITTANNFKLFYKNFIRISNIYKKIKILSNKYESLSYKKSGKIK